ncbi:hypothetical protein RUM44_006771, partial [Polyplax serrata]
MQSSNRAKSGHCLISEELPLLLRRSRMINLGSYMFAKVSFESMINQIKARQ